MKMTRLNIQLPKATKAKLDAMRGHGYTASGYIRRLIEEDLRIREESNRTTTEAPRKRR
jgi:hypothetical protein